MIENSNIRRIDELGRIVIPKDIRKKLRIQDGESLEIFIEEDAIKIKKYSVLKEDKEYIDFLIDMWSRITGNNYILTDRDKVYASNIKSLQYKIVDNEVQKLVFTCTEEKNEFKSMMIGEEKILGHTNIIPIIVENNRVGLLIEYNENRDLPNNMIIKLLKIMIEKKLET